MTDRSDNTNKRLESGRFFAGDGFTLFAHKKTEKITSALYLVTNLLSDSEPIKAALRDKSLNILNEILPHSSSALQSRIVSHIHPSVSELMALLGIAQQAGLISEMNGTILGGEYKLLVKLLQEGVEAQKGDLILSSSLFNVEESLLIEEAPVPSNYQNDILKRHVALKTTKNTAPKESASKRHSMILRVLSTKKDATTSDIKDVIQDCSEKTIQRDLKELIDSGKIIRHGKRRWAHYSLA